jgi:hypothetical protein
MTDREHIPAELKRRILVEAGHRCAIPTCRHPTTEIAHIIPYAQIKEHQYHNLIALCPNCHTRYDRGEIDRRSMLVYKRKIAFLSDRYSRFELNALDYLRAKDRIVIHGVLIVKNLLDDGLIENIQTVTAYDYEDGSPDETLDFVAVLTEKGKQFLADWENSENVNLTY